MINKRIKFVLNFLFFLGWAFSGAFAQETSFEKKSSYLAIDKDTNIRVVEWSSNTPVTKPYTIVILSGFGMISDQYHEFAQSFLRRGFAVWSFDWRGQGLSSKTTNVKTLGHIDSFETHLKDLSKVLSSIPSDKPFILFGLSMGGHLTFSFLESNYNTSSIKAAIAVAPMVDIQTSPFPRWTAKALAYIMTSLGAGEKFVVGRGPFELDKFHYNPHEFGDPEKFVIHKTILEKNPDAVIGAPSYQWLRAAFESMETAKNEQYLKKISCPILIIQAEHENKVINAPQEKVCEKMKKCKLVQIKGSHHSLHADTNEVLKEFWKEVDQFMENKVLN